MVFAALGDATRLSVLAKLCNGVPQSISRLTAGTHLSRQAVTKHLRVLANAGVVRRMRVGRVHECVVWLRAPWTSAQLNVWLVLTRVCSLAPA